MPTVTRGAIINQGQQYTVQGNQVQNARGQVIATDANNDGIIQASEFVQGATKTDRGLVGLKLGSVTQVTQDSTQAAVVDPVFESDEAARNAAAGSDISDTFPWPATNDAVQDSMLMQMFGCTASQAAQIRNTMNGPLCGFPYAQANDAGEAAAAPYLAQTPPDLVGARQAFGNAYVSFTQTWTAQHPDLMQSLASAAGVLISGNALALSGAANALIHGSATVGAWQQAYGAGVVTAIAGVDAIP